MRDYGKVSAQFWVGKTGRALRGDPDAQLVALYLMTSPHSNMIGVFHCPLAYIAHETGLPLEGASKGLRRLIEGQFCTYDEESETVWVHEMAKFQIGDALKAGDNQCKAIQKAVDNIAETRIRLEFAAKYAEAFHLVVPVDNSKPLRRASKAPSKPGTGTGAGTGSISSVGTDQLPPGFARFWAAWPKTDRKEGKAECLKRWKARGLEQFSDEIVAHVETLKATKKWQDGFEPAPLTFVNQRRWEDSDDSGAEVVNGVPQAPMPDWMRSAL